jgi:hypothetical protein
MFALSLLREDQLLDDVVLALQRLRRGHVAAAFVRHRVLLAVALREVDRPRLTADRLDERVRDVLLLRGGHALRPPLVADDDLAVVAHLVLRGDRRVPVDVDQLQLDLLRQARVLLQQVAEGVDADRLIRRRQKAHDLDRRIELRDDVAALVGQAELLVLGEVPALVLALADVVHGDQDAEHDHHAGGGERAVARLAAAEHVGDVPPLAGHVDEDADEAGPREVEAVLVPLGRQVGAGRSGHPDCDRGEHERCAQPADDAEDSVGHRPIRASVPCRPTSRSGRART